MNFFRINTFLLLFVFLAFSEVVIASEIRGKIWVASKSTPITGASINITCNGKLIVSTRALARDGSYSIRSIPSDSDCNFTLNYQEHVSSPIPFGTQKSVTVLNAEVRLLNNRLLVLPR